MKSMVVGLVMLAGGVVRSRETPLDASLSRAPGDGGAMTTGPGALGATATSASLDRAPLPEARDDEETDGSIVITPPPVPGEWQVACELKSGAALIFDRRSVRELGAVTLVRWAAPADPRTQDQVFTALVSCREKTIEAAWPGKRSETRAGTCGRHLVEAVCEKKPQPRR